MCLDFNGFPMDFYGFLLNFYGFASLSVGKHSDLELIVHFVLVFAGIAHLATEIHSVFKQKKITQ